jgi:glycosyltransferase involved in cell wall biosynthesis
MRILLAIDSYPPPLVGGRDLQVQMLAHELVRRNHDVEVVSLGGLGGDRTEMDGDIPVHRIAGWSRALNRFYLDPERPWHPPIPDPGLVRSLYDLVRQRRPHVVHAHSWILHSLLPFLPSRQTRLVVTMHDYGFVCPKNTFVYRDGVCDGPRFTKCVPCASGQYGAMRAMALTTGLTLTRRSRHRVDRYIAVSTPVARACASLAADGQGPLDVIPPFLSDDSLESVAAGRPTFVPAEGDYVMFAGALGPHKGVDVLLEAYGGVDPEIPLVLAGLPHPSASHRIPEGVIVAENVSHDDVLRAWKHCAVAVVPSRWPDPCPTVAIEAMAAGRPIVASAVGGLPDLVLDGTTGVLVPPGDVSALRASIVRLLADPELRASMGQAGRQRASGYLASAVVPKIERVYEEVVATTTASHHREST